MADNIGDNIDGKNYTKLSLKAKQMNYTKQQKIEYFKSLRERWTANKAKADQDIDAKAKWEAIRAESPTFTVSYYGFYFAYMAMKSLNFEGLPYVDTKTFNGWHSAGFKVKKGEKSKIYGITWISGDKKNSEDDEKHIYPKVYKLFHKTQVEAI